MKSHFNIVAQYKVDLHTLSTQHIQYPAVLRTFLGEKPPKALTVMGNLDILKNKKLALFCSKKCPGEIILATYDFMKTLRDAGITIISGFHSPIEQECLNVLIRGNQPVIFCPARSIETMLIPQKFKEPLEKGQLLILSVFSKQQSRMTAKMASERNLFVAALADAILVPYAEPNGRTEELCRLAIEWGKPLCTAESNRNAKLFTMGAKPVTLENMSGSIWNAFGIDQVV